MPGMSPRKIRSMGRSESASPSVVILTTASLAPRMRALDMAGKSKPSKLGDVLMPGFSHRPEELRKAKGRPTGTLDAIRLDPPASGALEFAKSPPRGAPEG